MGESAVHLMALYQSQETKLSHRGLTKKEEVSMTSLRNRMLVTAALALAAISASAVPASAQSVCTGSFTLPHEVRWQAGTLPAGDYTFTMDSVAGPARITLRGPNGSAFVSAVVADKDDRGGQSRLTIVGRGSKAFVHDLYLAPIGRRLKYSVPKAPKEELLAQGPVTTEHILVAMK